MPFASQNHFFDAKTTFSVILLHKVHVFACFCVAFFFLYFVPLVTEKVVFASKKLISTSKGGAEHPLAGQNSQQASDKETCDQWLIK